MGKVVCEREFSAVLGGKFIRLDAAWKGARKSFEEHAYFGQDLSGALAFWSFTSDGRSSSGRVVAAQDLPPECLCFEAVMPAGLARMAYWPAEGGGFVFAVEAKRKRGWNRFIEQHFDRVG